MLLEIKNIYFDPRESTPESGGGGLSRVFAMVGDETVRWGPLH